MRKKMSKYDVFLVRIFPYSDWIRRFTEQISVFSPNTRRYGSEKTPYFDIFYAVKVATLQWLKVFTKGSLWRCNNLSIAIVLWESIYEVQILCEQANKFPLTSEMMSKSRNCIIWTGSDGRFYPDYLQDRAHGSHFISSQIWMRKIMT